MRQINSQDKEILQHLQRFFRTHVKLDYDIMMEPCVFAEDNGLWELVYKLSSSGHYLGYRDTYVRQAYEAITAHYSFKWEQRHKETEETYKEEKKFQDNFHATQARFAKGDFVERGIYGE